MVTRTFRSLFTIGSSFKSSFFSAATSIEYTLSTVLTSAACTDIYDSNSGSNDDISLITNILHKNTHFRFPHNLTLRSNPDDQNKLLPL